MFARYRVRVAKAAKADLRDILNYVTADRPSAAHKLELRFAKSLKSLRHLPERFPKIRENLHTKFVYRHVLVNSYRVIFRIFGNEVLIVRILHQARRFRRSMLFGFD